ncbi:hypothetical protein PVT71_21735 [Salipiger sp. H15]|uniref:Uncharacterized protein n=1 Tax=Alloyangia sp. H15 TaxID=3029062 RepID=A0AAU8ANL3_9RHOB
MTHGPRITLRIGRITGATGGLSRAALEQALHAEIARIVAQEGGAAFGSGGARAHVAARLEGGQAAAGDRAAGLAAATLRAVRS